jgi:hypothetical protein
MTIEPAELQQLIAQWWFSYDEGRFDFLAAHLTDDAHFVCRTDTGMTDWEELVRADVRGRDPFLEWQTHHRLESPYPLRHSGTNVHITAVLPDGAVTFSSYIAVTQIVNGSPSPVPGGIVNGTVRKVDGELRIGELEVVLDTADSVAFNDVRELQR